MRRTLLCIGYSLAGAMLANLASAQTTINGKDLTLRSAGSQSGNGWSLSSTGYLGTYITIPNGGSTVSLTINATEGTSGSGTPHLNLVVADTKVPFDVSSTSATNYSASVALSAGTYFVRTERDYPGNTANTQPLTVNSLSLNTIGGGAAAFSNTNTATIALAASDTYIANFRKGPATVSLTGPGSIPLLPGTPVNVDLARNAFNFGTAVPGSSSSGVSAYLGSTGTAQQTNYQSHLNQNFNAVVPENMGKWANNEATRNSVTMSGVDTILNYAQSHNMRARMHNLIWGSQQPGWVSTGSTSLLVKAAGGDAAAKTDLRNAMSSRIGYYVGTGVAGDRANKYSELDIYNESYHTGSTVAGSYWNVYTPTGIADIYREAHAVAPNTRLYTNEYNIYADTNDGSKYANYYQSHIESLRNAGLTAGYGDVVGGIGTQYYVNNVAIDNLDPNRGGAPNNAHNPARIMQTIQNLSTEGVPVTLTEFGVKSGASTTTAATMLSDALRITYGNAGASGFFMWGFQAENGGGNLFAPAAALYTLNTSNWSTWTITDAGKAWQDLLGIQDWDGNPNNGWTTHVVPTVDANGNVTFTGFYGDYNIGSQSAFKNLTLNKGTTGYSLALTAPPTWSLWIVANSGSWSTVANWTSGGVANAIGQTAYFGPAGAARSVNVDGAKTVGMLAFDSANQYTISGNTITLDGSAGVAAVYVANGSHQIDAPLALNDNTTVTVVPSNSSLTISNLQESTVALTKAGPGTLVVNAVRAAALNVNAGTVKVLANGADSGTSNVQSLAVAGATDSWQATVDLTDNAMVVDYSGASPLATIANQIKTAYSGGAWTGNGITSSIAAAVAADGSNPHKTALGYAEAADLGAGSFAGQSVDATAILIRYTLFGDANLDRAVDTVDFNILAANFGLSGKNWSDGNFNFDDVIDTIDFNQLAANFSQTLPSEAGSLVPEPATLGLIGLAPLLLLLRKRR